MIGTQRSGSNLFRLMINQLPEIAAPHPPHILIRLMPLIGGEGDLSDPQACDRNDLYAVMAAVYDTLRETWSKRSWCCKSLGNVKYAGELADRFPDAKFIYLYRDGRDVALSFTKAIEGEKHYYNIAKDWDQAQQTCLRLRERIGDERMLSISYEALTGDETGTMKSVSTFLEATFTEEAVKFYETAEAHRAADASNLWENVTKPVNETSAADLRIFESVAGRSLDELGYQRYAIKAGQELVFTPEEIAGFDRENKRLKHAAWEMLDPDDRRRREEQKSVVDAIAERNAARQQSDVVGSSR